MLDSLIYVKYAIFTLGKLDFREVTGYIELLGKVTRG